MSTKYCNTKRADEQSGREREKFPGQWASGGGLAKKLMAGFAKLVLLLSLGGVGTFAQAATNCNAVTEIPVSECQSLMELYNSTNGTNWTNKTGWNQTNTPCSWYGVTCSAKRVIGIALKANNLKGMIPNLLLPNLQGLLFTSNQLNGTIPNFTSLPNLTYIYLDRNQLSGSIPNFSNLPNLEQLWLGMNQLSGTIPNFNLPKLRTFILYDNQLSGTIPNFTNLPNLTSLQFTKNQLSGTIPNFDHLPNLGGLQLNHNQLSGIIPDFTNLPKLTMLLLNDNQLSGTIPNFTNLPNLKELSLGDNQLSGTIPNFTNLPKLTELFISSQLSSSQLSGSIPNFSNLPNLTSLQLRNNQLSGSIPNFGNLPKLELLALDSNQLSGSIPNFSNLPKLIGLYLNDNQLSGSIPNFTAFNLANLNPVLFFNNCGLTAYAAQETVLNQKDPNWKTRNPSCPATFNVTVNKTGNGQVSGGGTYATGATVNLTATPDAGYSFGGWSPAVCANSFAMPNNNLTCTASFVPTSFSCNTVTEIPVAECQELLSLYNSTNGANWRNKTGWNQTNTPCSWYGIVCNSGHVSQINLSDNQLSGSIPNFSNLPNLTSLGLSDNQLSGTIPNFSNLPNLTQLNLRGNQLSGSIPNFSNLPNLTGLYLYGNQLSGTIPNFNNLLKLTMLYLYDNQLSGSIPNFSNLPNLTQLNLQGNQLSGTIPNFSNLPNLTQLSLSFNQLSGSVPNFSNLPKLAWLVIQMNQLSGSIPNFTNLPNLMYLYLNVNQLSGSIPNFSNLPKLAELYLNNNQLRGTIPNLNWSSFGRLNLFNNCDLTAYDAAQESVLNQKAPGWKTRNPNCPAMVSLIATPATPAICAGSTFDVTIRAEKIDTQPVNGVEMSLKFDPSQLQVNSITNSGVLDYEMENTNAAGDIRFMAGIWENAAPTSSFDVFTVSFTALSTVAAGSTTLIDVLDNAIMITSGASTLTASAKDATLTFSQCLNYQVNLQRATPKPDASWKTDLKVSVGSKTNAKEYLTTSDTYGKEKLTLANPIVAGDYMCVKNSHTLANKVVQPFGNPVDFLTLWEGDATDDNKINLQDLSPVTLSNGKCVGTAGYNAQADFNVDGCVNINDRNYLRAPPNGNLNKASTCPDKLGTMYRRGTRDGNRNAVTLGATTIPTGLKVGTSFDYTVQVNANEAQAADGAAVYLNFDPAKLSVNRLTAGQSFDFEMENSFDNTKGEINFTAGTWDNPAPTQTVDLVTINFTLLSEGGEQTLAFSTTEDRQTMIAGGGEEVTALSEDGKIVVEPVTTTPPPVITGNYTTSGTLLDKAGNPLANATVQMGDKTTTTDELGNWSIDGLFEGTYDVVATKDNFNCVNAGFELGNQDYHQVVNCEPVTTLKILVKPSTYENLKQGEDLTYTMTIVNGGSQTATGITLNNILPEGSTLVALESVEGSCDAGTLVCSLPNLTPGASVVVTLTLHHEQTNTLKTTATLTSNEYPVDVKTSWKAVKPYLSVTVTDTPDPVVMLGTLHYTAQVELSANAPQPTATGVTLTMQLPQGVNLETVTTDQGTCDSTQLPLITCQLSDLSTTPIPLLDKEGLGVVSDKEGLGMVSVATVKVDLKLADAGLLVLTQDAKVTAKEYPAHTVKTRTNIFVPKDLKVDAVFVLDTTHSMQGELNSVIAGLKQFIEDNIDSSLSPTIALIGFKDDVKVLAFTKDLPLLQKVIAGLKAEGGGLCPEASVEALNVALDHVKDNGVIFFSTDASPYDDADMTSLLNRLQTQAVKFHAVVTGDCSEGEGSFNELK